MHLHFQAAAYVPLLKQGVIQHGIHPLLHLLWKSARVKHFAFLPFLFPIHGESLDYKAPLLKALEALNKAAVDVCNYFDKNVTKVTATLGWEQEYFVIDEGLHNARPDLVLCGRTVFGQVQQKDSNWKIIISVLFLKEYMLTCGIMKKKVTNWEFH